VPPETGRRKATKSDNEFVAFCHIRSRKFVGIRRFSSLEFVAIRRFLPLHAA
jgi:hypothetical protein